MNSKNTLLMTMTIVCLVASSGLFAAAKARAEAKAKRQAQAAQARAARAQARAARAGIAGMAGAAKEEQDLQAAIRASLQEVSGAGEETKVSAAEFEAARVAAAQAAAVAKRAEIQEKREAAQAAAVARRAEAQEKMAARRAQGRGVQGEREPLRDITGLMVPVSEREIGQVKSPQVHVLKVAPQQAAECGYHAVINTANAVLPFVTGDKASAHAMPELRQFITGIRKDKNDQWLDTIEVEKIARDIYQLPEQYFSIIGDITGPIYRNFLSKSTIDAIKLLQTSDGALHGFIIGSMRQEGGRSVMGHWISVVARRDAGVIHYDVRDSAAGSGANSAMVNALIDLVSANPADLTLGSETLSLEMMRDIRLDFDGYFYDAMLDKIAKLLAIVEQASRAGQQKFKVDLEQLRTYLSQMNDELLADENRNLKDTLVTIINGYLE